MIYSIQNEEPEPLTALRTGVPIALDGIIAKALAKEPGIRYQNVEELPADLRGIDISSLTRSKIPITKDRVTSTPLLSRPGAVPWIVLATVMTLLAVLALFAQWRNQKVPPGRITKLTIALPRDVSLIRGAYFGSKAALSPDGSLLAFIGTANDQSYLYIRRLDRLESVAIPGTEGANNPFFSPDGHWIGFFTNDELKKISVAGGEPISICNVAGGGRGADWGLNDRIVFATYPSGANQGLMLVSVSEGSPEPLTIADSTKGESTHRFPQFMPGGEAVLFTIQAEEGFHVAVLNLKTGEIKTVVENASYGRYVPTGHIIFMGQSSLMAALFDLPHLEISGTPVPILDTMMRHRPTGSAHFSFSDNGDFAYVEGLINGKSTLVWVDCDAKEQPLPLDPRAYLWLRLSPDGRRMAISIVDNTGIQDIWIYEFTRETLTRLTYGLRANYSPIWTSDSKSVIYTSLGTYRDGIYSRIADGSGKEIPIILRTSLGTGGKSLFPDEQLLAFDVGDGDIWMISLNGEKEAHPFLKTQFDERSPAFSPDGRWLAYVSNESGREEVYVVLSSGSGGKWQISNGGGKSPMWARSGRELFYLSDENMMAVAIDPNHELSAAKPKILFRLPEGVDGTLGYDVSGDDQRFIMHKTQTQSNGSGRINIVLNWFRELKLKVPTKE